ncbi:MAG: hypothetical protein V4611_00870 [Patescibacteria group bacterium]
MSTIDTTTVKASTGFAITFVKLLLSNFVLAVVTYSSGLMSGIEGEPTWDWDSFLEIVGSFGPALATAVAVALLVIAVRKLSEAGHHNWIIFIALAAFVAGLVLSAWLDVWNWATLAALGLVVFTFLLTLVIRPSVITTVWRARTTTVAATPPAPYVPPVPVHPTHSASASI